MKSGTKGALFAIGGIVALLGIVGGVVAGVLLFLLPFILIISHGWPWFHPEPSFIVPHPAGHPPLFWGTLALLMVSLGIRLTRRIGRGLSVVRVVLTVLVGTIGWYIHAHTGLGTASYFIFRWFLELGAFVGAVYAVLSFLGGLAPGFLGAQGVLLYLVYGDPRLVTYVLLPAVIGELIDSLLGDIRESGEKPRDEQSA